jgi:very-short-patch-repair endonuclease
MAGEAERRLGRLGPLLFHEVQKGRWQPEGLTEGYLPRKRRSGDLSKARKLRRQMTLPEVLLWNLLRKSPDGMHFRRQEPLGKYVLDFYCAKAKVCIEVDGIAHNMGDRPERDELRDDELRAIGIEVVRIPATDVLKSPEEVARALVRYCKR